MCTHIGMYVYICEDVCTYAHTGWLGMVLNLEYTLINTHTYTHTPWVALPLTAETTLHYSNKHRCDVLPGFLTRRKEAPAAGAQL